MSDTSTSTSICYVTMFLDIGRAEWKNVFTRTFEQYLKDFEPFIPLFNKKTCENNLLVVFIDKKWENKLVKKIDTYTNEDNNFNNLHLSKNAYMIKLYT